MVLTLLISRRSSLRLAAILAFGLAAPLSAQAEETLRIGVEAAYPPFSMKTADGELTGFDIEIASALCAEMGRTCEFVEQDWDGIIPALKARKYDMIVASMSITEERMRQVDFTERYYYSMSGLLAPVGTDVTATKDGTAGKTIGIQRGTAHECYYEQHFADAELKAYATTEEAYLDLTAGRVDSLLVDTLPAQDWIKANDAADSYALVADDLYDVGCFGEGVGIAVREGDDELREALNTAIKGIRANGVYTSINDKYFDVDIYGPES